MDYRVHYKRITNHSDQNVAEKSVELNVKIGRHERMSPEKDLPRVLAINVQLHVMVKQLFKA